MERLSQGIEPGGDPDDSLACAPPGAGNNSSLKQQDAEGNIGAVGGALTDQRAGVDALKTSAPASIPAPRPAPAPVQGVQTVHAAGVVRVAGAPTAAKEAAAALTGGTAGADGVQAQRTVQNSNVPGVFLRENPAHAKTRTHLAILSVFPVAVCHACLSYGAE